jgi:hypothetical protein
VLLFCAIGLVLLIAGCASSPLPGPMVPTSGALPEVATGPSEYFVAPDGSPDGSGSKAHPWDLSTAIAQPKTVRPGDTIWLRGGIYRGDFVSKLTGTEGAPITLRQFPGERAIIDSDSITSTVGFAVLGEWAIYWGFEITNSQTKRISQFPGNKPADMERATGLTVRGPHVKIINLIIHDAGQGVGFWSEALDAELYGCLIYNNGWQGSDKGWGHAIYTQNQEGTKHIIDNILFDQFGFGLHAYGDASKYLRGFQIEGNVSFNNGALAREQAHPNILVGGYATAENVLVKNNYTYTKNSQESNVRLGYHDTPNKDLILTENYFAGGSPALEVLDWQQITLTHNTVIGENSLVALHSEANTQRAADYHWDNNRYFAESSSKPFLFPDEERDFSNWRQIAGIDQQSEFSAGRPAGVQVFVRPNTYETGRATIIVYNWPRQPIVNVDMTKIVSPGAHYEVRNVQDYFGTPVLSGVYNGGAIGLPMTATPPPTPVGGWVVKPSTTGPDFNVFILTSSSILETTSVPAATPIK